MTMADIEALKKFAPDVASDARACIDMTKLDKLVAKALMNTLVIAHAADCMNAISTLHPFEAFSHAVNCEDRDNMLSVEDRTKLLVVWCKYCKAAEV